MKITVEFFFFHSYSYNFPQAESKKLQPTELDGKALDLEVGELVIVKTFHMTNG